MSNKTYDDEKKEDEDVGDPSSKSMTPSPRAAKRKGKGKKGKKKGGQQPPEPTKSLNPPPRPNSLQPGMTSMQPPSRPGMGPKAQSAKVEPTKSASRRGRVSEGLTTMSTAQVKDDKDKQERIKQIVEEQQEKEGDDNPNRRSNIDNPTFVPPPLVSRAARHGGQSVYYENGDMADDEIDEEFAELMIERDELEETNKAQEATILDLEKQIESLRADVTNRIEREELKKNELKNAKDLAEETISGKTRDLESMLNAVEMKMNEMKAEHEKELEEMKAKHDAVEFEKNKSEAALLAALDREKDMSAEATKLSAQLKHDLEVIQSQQSDQTSELGKIRIEKADLESQNIALEKKLQEVEAEKIESESKLQKQIEEEKAELSKLKERLSQTDKEYRENKQTDFGKIRDMEDTIVSLNKEKEMLINKALQMSGKNAGSMLRIQELEDQIERMEHGLVDTESKMKDAAAKAQKLQATLQEESESRAMVTAHMYFAKKSLKKMSKERSDLPTNNTSRSHQNLRASLSAPSVGSHSSARSSGGGGALGMFKEIIGTSARSFTSVEVMGETLLSDTLPEEADLERKMS